MDFVVLIFWGLASLILASSWAVVNGNDIVHSVVWLATVFLLTACLFILADAEFFGSYPGIGLRWRYFRCHNIWDHAHQENSKRR